MSLRLSSAKRLFKGSLHRDLVKTPLMEMMEILFGDFSKRPLQEICAERALIEILYRDLARRPLLQIVYRDPVNSIDLAQRSCVEILTRDLTLRSLSEILCGGLFKTPCADSLAKLE